VGADRCEVIRLHSWFLSSARCTGAGRGTRAAVAVQECCWTGA